MVSGIFYVKGVLVLLAPNTQQREVINKLGIPLKNQTKEVFLKNVNLPETYFHERTYKSLIIEAKNVEIKVKETNLKFKRAILRFFIYLSITFHLGLS